MDITQRSVVLRHITHLIDDSKGATERNNKVAAAYLACIAGMWTNYCKLDFTFPYTGDVEWLNEWFRCGYDAFNQSIGLSDELRKQQLEYEKKWAKDHPDPRKKEYDSYVKQSNGPAKKSKWDIKLW